ncbi:4-coumarate--CoA ligase-like 1 [Ischnura elegans]|uniref:4-coumarate--CoA ligase-like 1 n=1 Tax=Ischnura elegans TaxID=197161 RepID=UPI001ED8B964|nr:4-coumarate--CoA ligase-like 1 [Ischnura elegans]
MGANGRDNTDETNGTNHVDPNIVKSPLAEKHASKVIPDVPFTDILFQAIDMKYDVLKDRIWVGDIRTGVSYKYRDIKPMSRKVASALSRLGFMKGDVMFYCTYDCSLIYLVNMGVWLCGGAVRGSFQRDEKEMFVKRMREVSVRFAICDSEAAATVKWAVNQLDWRVTILSIGGKVEGALSIEDLIESEDCSAYPKDAKINTKEDIFVITSTSGSSGTPKGVMNTHHALTEYISSRIPQEKIDGNQCFTAMTTFKNAYSSIVSVLSEITLNGASLYTTSRFEVNSFMKYVLSYRPSQLILYAYELHAFLQPDRIRMNDLSFIKCIKSVGAVIHYATAKTLQDLLPQTRLIMSYALSETLIISSPVFGGQPEIRYPEHEGIVAGIKYKKLGNETYLTCGKLYPGVIAKVVDPSSGKTLGSNEKGSLLIKTTLLMKGYITETNKEISKGVDGEGWLHTGDEGFFDEDGWLYIVGRSKFTFKHCGRRVCPTDVEAVVINHPSVESVVVVGVPNPKTTADAKAYVILKPAY